MIRPTNILAALLAIFLAANAHAADGDSVAFEGSYLFLQDDKYQRVLSLDRGGIAFQVSDLQTLVGFSGGQGAWEQTGPNTVVARVVDFSYERDSGKRLGPSMILYQLEFDGLEAGRYQKVSGTITGNAYAVDDNPMDPSKPSVRQFSIGFKGRRITAK